MTQAQEEAAPLSRPERKQGLPASGWLFPDWTWWGVLVTLGLLAPHPSPESHSIFEEGA